MRCFKILNKGLFVKAVVLALVAIAFCPAAAFGAEEKGLAFVTISERGTTLKDTLINGDLIISKEVGDGNVYIRNVEITGDLIVEGGGSQSVYIADSQIGGKLDISKKDVRVVLDGETTVSTVKFYQSAVLEAGGHFKGSVDTVIFAEGIGYYKLVQIKVPVQTIVMQTDSSADIFANVDTVTIGENVNHVNLEVCEGAVVKTIVADGKVSIRGDGTVSKLFANVDGISKDARMNILDIILGPGVEKPPVNHVYVGGNNATAS